MGDKGIVASTAGLAILLNEGIGDTIRVSLTPEPGARPRARRSRSPSRSSSRWGSARSCRRSRACPGCGRTTSTFFQEMAQQIQTYLKDRMPEWSETLSRASRTCASRSWAASSTARASRSTPTSGSRLPGTFEEPVAPVFVDGKLDRTLRGEGLVDEFIGILEDYVERRYPTPGRAAA